MDQSPYRVLIVDDEPMVRELALRNFIRLGFVCDTAEDGDVAAAKYATNNYDAVVTDLKMPNRNGHSLAVELLAQPSPPVVVVTTAIIEARISRDLVTRGIDKIFHKPVDHLQLATSLRTLIQSRRARTQHDVKNISAETHPASALPNDFLPENAGVIANPGLAIPASSSHSDRDGHPHRVLVVDDEPMLRSLLQRALINDGFDCSTAENGCEAAEKYSEHPYDVVVTDLRMPIRNGHSFAREILRHRPRPVVVITTGIVEPQIMNDLMDQGAALVMHKPISHVHLTATIRDLLSRPVETDADDANSGQHRNESGAVTGKATQAANGIMDDSVEIYLRCTSAEYDSSEVAEWVERDPELRQRVMKQANTWVSGSPVLPAQSTLQAVIRIGPKQVAQLAITDH